MQTYGLYANVYQMTSFKLDAAFIITVNDSHCHIQNVTHADISIRCEFKYDPNVIHCELSQEEKSHMSRMNEQCERTSERWSGAANKTVLSYAVYICHSFVTSSVFRL